MHEDLRREVEIEGSSDRSFGLVFAAVFFLIGFWPMLGGQSPRIVALIIGAAFALIALVWPPALHPLNRVWLRVGLLLAKLIHPVVLALLFYVVVTPVGLLMRLLGKDPLRLRFERSAKTYWIYRQPPGPAPETMANQF